jgi:hypothetical protein
VVLYNATSPSPVCKPSANMQHVRVPQRRAESKESRARRETACETDEPSLSWHTP